MAIIQVTPDLLKSKSAELRSYRTEHDEAMQKMRALVNGLNEIWKGNAQQAFVDNFESMQGTFTQFSELLEGYAQLMDTAAEKLEETDQDLQAAMTGFGE